MKQYKSVLFVIVLLVSTSVMAQQSYNLEKYREAVLNYNQQLKASKESTLASIANEKSSKSSFLPRLELQGQAGLDLTNMDLFDAPKGSYHPYNYNAALVLTQPIISGSVNDQFKVNKIATQISQISEKNVSDNISYQADVYYWTAAANKELLAASELYLSQIKELYKTIKTRYDEKYIAKNDLLMVNTRLKEAELQQKKAQTQYDLAVQQFNILMGMAPATPLFLENKIDEKAILPSSVDMVLALKLRSDYKAAGLQVILQENVRDLTLTKYNPYLGLNLTAGYGTGNPNYGDGTNFMSVAQLVLRVPILNFGERSQTKSAAQSAVNISKLQQQVVVDQIAQEVNAAWTKVSQSETQIAVVTESLANADESLELNTFSYNEGKISLVDVLQSQISWIQAYGNKIGANLSHKMAIAEYYRSMGMYAEMAK